MLGLLSCDMFVRVLGGQSSLDALDQVPFEGRYRKTNEKASGVDGDSQGHLDCARRGLKCLDKMALRTLAGRWRAGAGIAAAIAAGGTVAYCEDPKGVGFDPEALERGAKALREINKSPYAKKVCIVLLL